MARIVGIRVKGRSLQAKGVTIGERTVVRTGRLLKVATVVDEELIEGATVGDIAEFSRKLRRSGLGADIFCFTQRLPDVAQAHEAKVEWENVAAVGITTYENWLKSEVEYSVRKAVKRAEASGVRVEVRALDEALLKAICHIYNETPVRQGKAFWHYGKTPEAVREALATYSDRSLFLCAHLDEELIGFIKMTRVNTCYVITQILSLQRHFHKRTNNALLAKAVEICETKAAEFFVYGAFTYQDSESSLTEFKRRHGFQPIDVPRYYVPLSWKGYWAIKLRLYRSVKEMIPQRLLKLLLNLRGRWYRALSSTRRQDGERAPGHNKSADVAQW